MSHRLTLLLFAAAAIFAMAWSLAAATETRPPATIHDPAAAAAAGQFRLSHAGPDGDPAYSAFGAAIAYNSANNLYLVVWTADSNSGALANGELEIYGQRLNAATGAKIGGAMRISAMGPDGDPSYGAQRPAMAYNAANNEFLVVWQGDDNTAPLVDDEVEIFGQRLNAATGAKVGGRIRISFMGPNGNPAYDALNPAVAYNQSNNEYLVVWQGDDNSGSLVDNENEIYGQRLNAATGALAGGRIRLSAMGPDGDPTYRGQTPAVAYNATDNQYLVVWSGDDNTAPLVAGELEIFGQRLNAANGAKAGGRIRISNMGPNGNPAYKAVYPAVAYNAANNQYLVAWAGDDNSGSLIAGELEIFGQRLNAANGAKAGGRIRISNMGPDGSAAYGALHPAVAYDPGANRYLVVWRGDDDSGSLVAGEHEIFGQWLDAATGAQVLANDFRLSHMGSLDGNTTFSAGRPALAYNSPNHSAMIVWHGDDDSGGLVAGEFEIFARQLDHNSALLSVHLPLVIR